MIIEAIGKGVPYLLLGLTCFYIIRRDERREREKERRRLFEGNNRPRSTS